jgi:hypothetical protein
MEIYLLKGLDNYEFGLSKDNFIENNPNNINFELVEEEEELKTEAIHIEELNTSLYFDGDETELLLTACATENKDAILFSKKVFDLSKDEIIKLMKDHMFNEMEEDTEEWGEERLSFYDAMVDFFFEKGKLVSISWGILIL